MGVFGHVDEKLKNKNSKKKLCPKNGDGFWNFKGANLAGG
jgi:hypothetical protein